MRHKPTGGIRMLNLIDKGIPYRGGECIDLYNQRTYQGVFIAVTTRIDGCNHYWVTQICER